MDKAIMERVRDEIAGAEAIAVGMAAGMSSASGRAYDMYDDGPAFRERYKAFISKYHLPNAFYGYHLNFADAEERWAYWALASQFVAQLPAGQSYIELKKLLDGRNYHILSTNLDHQVNLVFPQGQCSVIQGDFNLLQCSRRCHDELYDWGGLRDRMVSRIDGTRIPSELVPTCPRCGAEMCLWGRPWHFLEGKAYHDAWNRFHAFLRANREKKLLFLELGVGMMTPEFIKMPFINWTWSFPHARYLPVSLEEPYVPDEMKDMSLPVTGDILELLQGVNALEESARQGRTSAAQGAPSQAGS
ncbi:MAG: hypothetical protein K6E40_12320 [Desulfovibrio sp.]|nr:hypothetical protein [Desulfovibrio sp.]